MSERAVSHPRRAAAVLGLSTLALMLLPPAHAAAPEVSLSGPDIQKLDWNTRVLQAADVDGDGLLDVLVANNDRATVDILYQLKPGAAREVAAKTARVNRWEPVVEDARFRRERVTTGVTMYDLASGDLNGDGRVDIIYTGDPDALTARYQQEDGTWLERRLSEAPTPIQLPGSLRLGDLDGDKRTDVVMLGQKELAIFYQNESGELTAPKRFPLVDENCYGLELFDADGDGRTDVVYLSNNKRDPLRVRLQNAQGEFGPEQAYAIKDARSTLQILSQADAANKRAAKLVFAQQRTGQLEFVSLEPAKKEKTAGPALRPRVFTPRAGGRTPAAYAFGDFNGDGREDVAVSDADGAQVFVYFRQPDGGFTVAERFPSFADVRSLASIDWDRDGKAELIVASLKEQSAGIAAINESGRLDYPKPLPGTGRPLAVAAGEIIGGGAQGGADEKSVNNALPEPTLVVLREERGKRWFDLIARDTEGAPKITATVELNGLKTDPRGLRLIDANQDGRLDVAIFTPMDSMRIFLQGPEGGFTDASAAAGFRKGLVDNLDAGALSLGDLSGEGGKPDMLVSAGGFTRALRIDDAGALIVRDQLNAKDTSAEITASFVIPAAKGKRSEVLLYDRKGEQFQHLRANKQGVYEVVDSVTVGRIDVTGAESRPTGRGGRPELFLLGKDRFWWLPLDRPDLATRSLESYTTDLPDINYSDVVAGDLTGDDKVELVTLDPDSSVVEILARDEAGKTWISRMHFKVFETDNHFQGRRGEALEPREAIVADVTGDGKKDLLLLVHDRVLIYPQQ